MDGRIFVCTEARPLTLPIVRSWHHDQSIRDHNFVLASDGVLWTNVSRGRDDSGNVYRRVTWRETLNLVNTHHPGILEDVIRAASEIQPHLIGMMEKYAEFNGNAVVQKLLSNGGTDAHA